MNLSLPDPHRKTRADGLNGNLSLHIAVISLRFLSLSSLEIAEQLNLDASYVRDIINSALGRILLRDMEEKRVEKIVDLRLEFEGILKDNIDFPKAVLQGQIKEVKTTRDKDGIEEQEEVTVQVGVKDRIKMFETVGKMAGLGNPTVIPLPVMSAERLDRIKTRAIEVGALAPSEKIEIETE